MPIPSNRAERRAHKKGKLPHLPDSKAPYPGRHNPTQTPRLWAARRSG
jgi:hypothetical protein